MRVLQVIDSLNAGGAERIAVHFANALSSQIEFSGIVVTRKEGVLRQEIMEKVPYFFLNKQSTFDLKAIRNFKKIIIANKIDIVHAHGTSFFTAFLVKLICFRVKILFHEHNGERTSQSFFKNIPLLLSTFFFKKLLVVNKQIEKWFHTYGVKKATYFPNFAVFNPKVNEETVLKGIEGKRIVCLANLRNPKNHQVLIEAFHQLHTKYKDWTLHLIGKIYFDTYFDNLKEQIATLNLSEQVFLYDAKSDIKNILSQSTIGVLCSTNEGFPLTLLEYGLCQLPVVSSNVGFCSEIIIQDKTGLLFSSNDSKSLATQIEKYITDVTFREKMSEHLNNLVELKYSEPKVIESLIKIYNQMT